jgi:hypothetical protein
MRFVHMEYPTALVKVGQSYITSGEEVCAVMTMPAMLSGIMLSNI